MSERPVDRAVDLCVEALSHRPSGLFTDIDGTISEIAPSPDLARVDDRARRALHLLSQQLDYVGVITGRAAVDGGRLLDAPGVMVVGNHGFERLSGSGRWVHPDGAATQDSITSAMSALQQWVNQTAGLEGVVLENKGVSASIHYRGTPDRDAAYQVLAPQVARQAEKHDLKMTEGKMVLELRPRAPVDKGTALKGLVSDLGLTGIVFLGDDVTDIDGFLALAELKDQGIATATIAIEASDTDPRVLETADVVIPGVAGCVELLERLASAPIG